MTDQVETQTNDQTTDNQFGKEKTEHMRSEYDLIGDIHGQGDRLERILSDPGYAKTRSGYRHSERTALFLGDLIDRGDQNRQVIKTVRDMVENGQATAILGNHEHSAIGFHQIHADTGLPLRSHDEKNIKQNKTLLNECPLDHPDTESVISWFKTLPVFLDLDEFRVVHACWDQDSIAVLSPILTKENVLTENGLRNVYKPRTAAFKAVETLLKGPEISLPEGFQIIGKSSHARTEVRVKWWAEEGAKTYRSIALTRAEILDTLPDLQADHVEMSVQYGSDEPVVFFGHFSLDPNTQQPVQTSNAICLDFSGAKDPPITAYTWLGDKRMEGSRVTQV